MSSEDLFAHLQQNDRGAIYADLSDNIELISHKTNFAPDIRNDIRVRLKASRKKGLQADLDRLQQSILTAADEEKAALWEKYRLLQKEYQQLD